MDNYNYPIGSDTSYAPWNDKVKEHKKYISLTISFPMIFEGDLSYHEINDRVESIIDNWDIDVNYIIDDLTIIDDD